MPRTEKLTVVDRDGINRDALSANGNGASRGVLNDNVLERAGVVDTKERGRLGLAAVGSLAILVRVLSIVDNSGIQDIAYPVQVAVALE
jgi:hypothetical protein